MKVKELIEAVKGANPELEVSIYNPETDSTRNIDSLEVKQKKYFHGRNDIHKMRLNEVVISIKDLRKKCVKCGHKWHATSLYEILEDDSVTQCHICQLEEEGVKKEPPGVYIGKEKIEDETHI
jgi:hypothetical protein